MAICISCNKRFPFWKINKNHLCAECQEQADEQKRQAEETERKRLVKERLRREDAAKELHSKLCFDYERIQNAKNLYGEKKLSEIVEIAENFVQFISVFSPNSAFEDAYWTACKKVPSIGQSAHHPTFGDTPNGGIKNRLTECGESIKKKLPYMRRTEKNTHTFIQQLETTVERKLEVSHNAAPSCIEDAREFKVTNITKNMIKESLADYIVVDVETTGLKAGVDEIIQIAATKYLGFEPAEYVCTYVKPRVEITAQAREINRISDEHLADAPRIEEIMDSFSSFLGKSLPLVGHNILFDLKFLHYAGCTALLKGRKYYDTLQLARRELKVADHDLASLTKNWLQIRTDGAHDAKFDCFAAGDLFKVLCDYIYVE